MEYGKALSRAWQITWRWKILWISGFLVSLASVFGRNTDIFTYETGRSISLPGWTGYASVPQLWAAAGGIVLLVLCLGFLIVVALWVVSVIARGALIAGVQQVEEGGSTTLRQPWRVGISRFWTLLVISILAGIPSIFATIGSIVETFTSATWTLAYRELTGLAPQPNEP
jgi:hypothetical protein